MTAPATAVIEAVLAAGRPERLVDDALDGPSSGQRLLPTHVLAVGKAAVPMALAACERFPAAREVFVVTTPQRAEPDGRAASSEAGGPREARSTENARLHVMVGDHPVPTERNLDAARATLRFAESVCADDHLLFLLSGGASALLCLPRPPLTLDHISALTRDMLASGADIRGVNTVRKHVELLKGGNLAGACAAPVTALVLADVLPPTGVETPPLDAIGSGPTSPDPTTFADAIGILDRFALAARHPEVSTLLHRGVSGEVPETPKPGEALFGRVTHRIIGSNRLIVDGACAEAERLGFTVRQRRDAVEGDAGALGRELVRAAASWAASEGASSALVWGGESTVVLPEAHGLGGRNQHMALSAAVELERIAPEHAHRITVLTFATDGRDGPTDAAGAVVDANTAARAGDAGIDPTEALGRADSYRALDAAGVLLKPGPTGTNLNDVAVALVAPA